MIGHWVHAAGTVHPDITGRSMLFADEDHGVITARTRRQLRHASAPPTAAPRGRSIDLPNTRGHATASPPSQNYAKIDATHWIACGPENTGTYMASGIAGHDDDLGDRGRGCHLVDPAQRGTRTTPAAPRSTPTRAATRCCSRRPTPAAAACTASCAARRACGPTSPATTSSPTRATARRTCRWSAARSGCARPTRVRAGPGLFKSTDYGATFTKISDVAAAVHGLRVARTRASRRRAARCTRPTTAASPGSSSPTAAASAATATTSGPSTP